MNVLSDGEYIRPHESRCYWTWLDRCMIIKIWVSKTFMRHFRTRTTGIIRHGRLQTYHLHSSNANWTEIPDQSCAGFDSWNVASRSLQYPPMCIWSETYESQTVSCHSRPVYLQQSHFRRDKSRFDEGNIGPGNWVKGNCRRYKLNFRIVPRKYITTAERNSLTNHP